MSRVFSGIKPSGEVHIGNYLGAIKNWISLQNDHDAVFCIVDLHAITVPQEPKILKRRTMEIAKLYLACGINPEKSIIFIQSHVPEHSELTWILNTFAKFSELKRMTQFKDKSQKEGQENVSVGLFDYPILMAADILLYDTKIVPVGQDQIQHLELTRTLARRFNQKFGYTFVIPEAYVLKESRRIMGLTNPEDKMGKSNESEYDKVKILDSPEIIRKKIKRAVTDSGAEVKYSEDKPALKNLINIYAGFSGKSPHEIEKIYEGRGYADFKKDLGEIIIEKLNPIQKKFARLKDQEVLEILEKGAQKARFIAAEKMRQVRQKIGFL